jgi:hypothetical protein
MATTMQPDLPARAGMTAPAIPAILVAALGSDWRALVAARLGVSRQAAQRWGAPRWPAPVVAALLALLDERSAAIRPARAAVARLSRA